MYKVNLHTRISDIPAEQWDSLCPAGYPFLRHAFLQALEESGSVRRESGWQPAHLELQHNDQCVLVMPLYLKSHSWGEYVFDWAWADAYERHGLPYYPKLVNAIPFTPAGGPRFGTSLPMDEAWALIPELLDQIMTQLQASSWHCLFPCLPGPAPKANRRIGCQYHWFNRNYESFDAFLGDFTARKRKSVRRERRKVNEQGLKLTRFRGSAISRQHLDDFYLFYQSTYLKRGRRGYLSADFFHRLLADMAEHLLMVLAEHEGQPVAAALYVIGDDTLYGRYWGCNAEYDSLHFEACYYQGIEFCIEQGLARFDPGAQGEHKIQRGFQPVPTCSLHRMADPDFERAVADFVQEEGDAMEEQIAQLTTWLPFRQPDQT
ncbi:GNAT family N-acetyltransferase [Marinobacterium weihaiense]|uniref:GNAT family N-acetyltransferase n=1 Tax=Marinobacterium weihaiense TaxID=2851016 RepID=A0ABS6M7K3_9GAMM|nr:GNAT family N-acetyltransferase [Marinobacterium weihaiense]MBV0932215.1 GNAT family N-acetyltransferase [Marinobacterium weihaiense]